MARRWRTAARGAARALGAGLLVLATGACSLLLDQPDEQCAATSECLARGGKFAQSVCGADRVCVPLLSEDCQRVVGTLDDDAIVIGLMTSLSSANSETGQARLQSAELALDELANFSVGLPRGEGRRPRSLVAVECDQDVDAERAARHLTDRLRVPVLIGPAHTGDTLEIATRVTIPAGVLMINPSAAATAIASLDDNGLVWRTSSSDRTEAYAISLLMPELEAELRAEQKLAPGDKIRVAVLSKTDAYGKGLADSMFPLLRFNGASVDDNQDLFLRREMPDASSDPDFDPAPIVAEVVALKPSVILLFGTAEMITKGMAGIEASWPVGSGAPARPRYVLTEGAKNAAVFDLIGDSNDDLRRRVRGLEPRPNKALYGAFRQRYESKFGASSDVYGMAGTYDAMYLLMYALVALGDEPPSGAALAAALGRMVPPGAPVDAGPDGFGPAFEALQAGENIDYHGVSGPLDFDVETGEAPADYDIWCVRRNTQKAPVFSSSGRYFDTAENALSGTLDCP